MPARRSSRLSSAAAAEERFLARAIHEVFDPGQAEESRQAAIDRLCDLAWRLFSAARAGSGAPLPEGELVRLRVDEQGRPFDFAAMDLRTLGSLYEQLRAAEDGPRGRKASGRYYTPPEIVALIVQRTLAPLLADAPAELRICDLAMGCGPFLLTVCDLLLARGVPPRALAERVLHGVDLDPRAVAIARRSVALRLGVAPADLAARLTVGDGLSDELGFGRFDAVVGNPPWVSYVGRAAQPLPADVRQHYLARFGAFAGYRNLQGLFVERAAELLRPGGRLGLLLPSSMSELAGYAPTRLSHDRLSAPDPELPDFGDGSFADVFQPCMALLSTRRPAPVELADRPWPIQRPDLTAADHELIRRLSELPTLPPHLFGERGVQTSGPDLAHLAGAPTAAADLPLRTGAEVRAFARRPARHHAEQNWFGPRLRTPDAWREVRLLIRQTAPYPIAALSDGAAFRNSLLAGFADATWPAGFLLAWLNATPVRWLHLVRYRDARQGMPQVKVVHLRGIPAPTMAAGIAPLTGLGRRLGERNDGIAPAEQQELDRLVAAALAVTAAELTRMAARLAAV